MPIDYSLPKPTPGTSRATSPTETEILTDISDTVADVGSRLDTIEADTTAADHIADPTGAHAASAVSIADAGGYFTGSDVEAALQEVGAASGASLATVSAAPAGFRVPGPYGVDKSSLRLWFAQVARRANGLDPVVMVQGDSIGEGNHADTPMKAWPHLLMQGLRARLGGTQRSQPFYIPAKYGVAFSGTHPEWTFSRTLSVSSDWGHGYRALNLSQNGDYGEVTVVGSSVDIQTGTLSGGGTLTVAVDGVDVTTINCNGATADGVLTRVTFDNFGPHTVRLTNTTGSNASCVLGGLFLYQGDETAGARVLDASKGGADTGDIIDGTKTAKRTSLLSGTKPHLVIIEMLVNDHHNGTPSATSRTNLDTYLSNVRSALPAGGGTYYGPSFLFLLPYETPDNEGVTVESWENYRAVAYDLARDNDDVAILDLGWHMGPTSDDGLSVTDDHAIYFDTSHPNNTGNQLIADLVLEQILPVAAVDPALIAQPVMPWNVVLDPTQPYKAAVGTWTVAASSALGAYIQNATGAAQNDYLEFDVMLAPGTWTLKLSGQGGTSRGIIDALLDDGLGTFSSIGTFDFYAASTTNYRASTSAEFTVTAPIRRTVRLIVSDKNASSSAYTAYLTAAACGFRRIR
jgi:lysophospholipase L1-like esterase